VGSQTPSSAGNGPLSPFAGYSSEHRPLGGYAVLVSAFGAAVAGAGVAARAAGREPPAQWGTRDVLMIGLATHKLSRLMAKDKVTSFLRAPFTEFQEASGQGEVEEKPRGKGVQLAVGELVVCPYCLAQWVAAGFVGGMVFAPRATRMVAAVYTAETVADFLQLAYLASEKRA
jgi:hypothetical protein